MRNNYCLTCGIDYEDRLSVCGVCGNALISDVELNSISPSDRRNGDVIFDIQAAANMRLSDGLPSVPGVQYTSAPSGFNRNTAGDYSLESLQTTMDEMKEKMKDLVHLYIFDSPTYYQLLNAIESNVSSFYREFMVTPFEVVPTDKEAFKLAFQIGKSKNTVLCVKLDGEYVMIEFFKFLRRMESRIWEFSTEYTTPLKMSKTDNGDSGTALQDGL